MGEVCDRESFLQRTRRLVVEKSQPGATPHTFMEFEAFSRPLLLSAGSQYAGSLLPSEHRQIQLEAGGSRGVPAPSQPLWGPSNPKPGPDSQLLCFSDCMPRTAVAMGRGNRSLGWSDLHSQLAFSGAKILRMSILLRPCDVSRITSGATPISFPTLQTVSGLPGNPESQALLGGGVNSRVPVLYNCICRVYNCAL